MQFPICGRAYFSSLLAWWRWQSSLVCLWTCTDAPRGARGKSVCSSPVLLAAPLLDGDSRCQGSWIAMSDVAWIHVSTWMQASLQCKANKSVGRLHWTIWWLPLVVPGSLYETHFHKVGIIRASLSGNFVSLGKINVLETLTYKVEQCRTIFRERKEGLGLKSCLIGCNMFGNIQVVMLCTEHMAFQTTLMSEV